MTRLKSLLTFGFALVLIHCMSQATTTDLQAQGIWHWNEVEMELLIICDKDFSDRFDQNHQKIIDYWAVYMRDVNMRFETLSSVDIFFRVTSLITINDTSDQPFIEEATTLEGGLTFSNLHDRFGKWIYANKQKFPGFDVALLMTSAEVEESDEDSIGRTDDYGACEEDHTLKMSHSIVVLHGSAAWGKDCGALEASLATLLGAPEDGRTFPYNKACGTDFYLMSPGACDNMQYFFSKCSNNAIENFIHFGQVDCLRYSDAPEVDVLETSIVTHPHTLDDQCKMVSGEIDAVAEIDEDVCFFTTCKFLFKGELAYMNLFPIDNSPCGNGKVCFRGRCLPQGHLLRNVGSDMCIYFSDTCLDNRSPIMDQCVESPTVLDQIILFGDDRNGQYLVSPSHPTYKCLSVEGTIYSEYSVKFSNCYSNKENNFLQNYFEKEDENMLTWNFLLIDNSVEFMLQNRHTKACVRVGHDGTLKLHKVCNHNDKMMRWMFIETPMVSLGGFNNLYFSNKYPAFESNIIDMYYIFNFYK